MSGRRLWCAACTAARRSARLLTMFRKDDCKCSSHTIANLVVENVFKDQENMINNKSIGNIYSLQM